MNGNEIVKNGEVLLSPSEEQLDKIEEEEIEYYDTVDYSPSGKAVIPIGYSDRASFFTPFCVKGDEELSPELFDYITRQESKFSSKEEVEICIFSERIPVPRTREAMANALRGRFAEEIVYINTELRRNMLFSLLLAFLGLIIEGVAIYLAIIDMIIPYMLIEVLGWVLVWTALDNFIKMQIPERVRRRRCRSLLRAEIRFRRNDSYETE